MPAQAKSKPRSEDHDALAQTIKRRIAEVPGMTQETVADDSGLNIRQVGEFARGLGNPNLTTFIKLARGLHMTPGELMTRRDDLLEEWSSSGQP